jgi:hypothetical protein
MAIKALSPSVTVKTIAKLLTGALIPRRDGSALPARPGCFAPP